MGGMATTMIQAEVTQLVTLIQTGVREVRLTITWPDGNREDNLSIATHFVILQASGTGVSTGLPPGQGSANSSGTPGAPGAAGGTPGSALSGSSTTTTNPTTTTTTPSPLGGPVIPTLTGTGIPRVGGN